MRKLRCHSAAEAGRGVRPRSVRGAAGLFIASILTLLSIADDTSGQSYSFAIPEATVTVEIRKDGAAKIAAFIAEIDKVLAVHPAPAIAASGRIAASGPTERTPADQEKRLEAEVQAKIEARRKARAEKDFARADAIRQELLAMGIVLEDAKDGVRWKKVGPSKA